MTMERSKKLIIIVAVAISVVAVIAFVVLFPLRERKDKSPTTISSTNIETSTTGTIESSTPTGNPPSAEDIRGVDTVTRVDTAIDKLPLITDSFSLFYYFENRTFLANINAKEGTTEAQGAKNDIKKWFAEQKVDISDIKIEYLYKK